jgi:arylsulfatase A-like enzyme
VLGLTAASVVGAALWLTRETPGAPAEAVGSPVEATAAEATAAAWDPTSWPLAFEVPEDAAPEYERVVLVTIDTLRADHVSSYRYARETTPFFDSLAERGVLFERAIAAASSTAPSHASMLTGLPPLLHGVEMNGHPLDPRAMDLGRMFEDAGFDTAAFVNVKFLTAVARSFRHVVVRPERGGPVADAAIAWMQNERRSERFFLWAHFFDPHHWKDDSRTPEAEVDDIRARTELDEDGLFDYIARLQGLTVPGPDEPFELALESGRRLRTRSRRDYLDLIDAYDAQILYADRQLERLFRGVEELGFPGRTLWIITADHGEGLASHGVVGHGSRVYQEQLWVPLLVLASDGSLGPRRVSTLVQHLDLLPTLAETLRGEVRARFPDAQGSSLWPLIRGEPGWRERGAFSQRHALAADALEESESRARRRRRAGAADETPTEADEGAEALFALQGQRFKYILHVARDDEFYDLETDPLELRNDIALPSPTKDEMKWRLDDYLGTLQGLAGSTDEPGIEEEFLEELRDLGYVR